jgi:hypothetical protein
MKKGLSEISGTWKFRFGLGYFLNHLLEREKKSKDEPDA